MEAADEANALLRMDRDALWPLRKSVEDDAEDPLVSLRTSDSNLVGIYPEFANRDSSRFMVNCSISCVIFVISAAEKLKIFPLTWLDQQRTVATPSSENQSVKAYQRGSSFVWSLIHKLWISEDWIDGKYLVL